MEKVKGIGGFLFRTRDPQAMKEWYANNLGLAPEADQPAWEQEAGMTAFEPFPADSDYFSQAQPYMLNFRVDNLDAMIEQLQQAGVKIDENRMEESYGKFAWIYDPEGNKIELWQPM